MMHHRGDALDDEFPGAERRLVGRRSDSFPTLAGEIDILGTVMDKRGGDPAPHFPFQSWAASIAFEYPPWARNAFCATGSAAEAFFLRGFTGTAGKGVMRDGWVVVDDVEVRPQVICRLYRIDFVARRAGGTGVPLAVEVDGLMWHRANEAQITRDYLRARRLTASGYTVVRFTAREAFASPTECWRQVRAILTARD